MFKVYGVSVVTPKSRHNSNLIPESRNSKRSGYRLEFILSTSKGQYEGKERNE
jgi:hypothetical protein